MSKIGKKNIIIPKESSIKIEGSYLTITGPKGTKKLTINDKIFSSKLNESEFQILPLQKKIDKKTSIMWGTYRSLINNAIVGVSNGHEKILELKVTYNNIMRLYKDIRTYFNDEQKLQVIVSSLTLFFGDIEKAHSKQQTKKKMLN